MPYTFAVPDLHGRYDLFKQAIVAIDRYGKGTTVFLGDYIDRGPQSKEIIFQLMEGRKDWVCLKGNHEDMMVGAHNGKYKASWWIASGGSTTLESFNGPVPASVLIWMDKLPNYHTDNFRIFAHAGVSPSVSMKKQDEKVLLWNRAFGEREDYFHKSGKYVVHGHTPIRTGPFIGEGRANLDCGAVWTNRLVVAVFKNAVKGKPVDLIELGRF